MEGRSNVASLMRSGQKIQAMWMMVCLCVCILLGAVVSSAAINYGATLSVTYDYGNFISNYERIVSTTSINWHQGAALCKTRGAGWGIAGIYSSGGNDAIVTIITGTEYFGGWVDISSPRMEADHLFVWKAGRFAGGRISSGLRNNGFVAHTSFCPFGPLEPRGLDEVGMNIFPNGDWNDVYADIHENRNTVLCEWSACTKKADCVESNTVSVSGPYTPSCVCACKAGFRGPKCQVSDEVVNVAGTSYAVWCETSRFDAPAAHSKCISKGPGWTLASIPSASVDTAIRNLSPGNIWIGASPVTGTLYGWQYGRHGGEFISVGSSCIAGGYCNWASGNPDRSTCGDGSPPETYIAVSIEYGRAWNDLLSNGCGSVRDFDTFCYACEQSVCSINIDCVAANTLNVTGLFYPDCQCYCRKGFGGSRCETNTTTISIDATEYRVLCDKSNVNVATAQGLCQALGSEWNMASIPSNAVHEGLSQLAPNSAIRIGSQHTGTPTSCQTWRYGRLVNVNLCASGVYRKWAAGQPSGASSCGDGTTQPQGYGMIFNNAWTNAFYGTCGRSSSPRCVACERSLCRQEDCGPTLLPQGYFPNCDCRTATSTVTFHKNSTTLPKTTTATHSLQRTISASQTTSTTQSSSSSVSETYNSPTTSHNTHTQSISSTIISGSSTPSLNLSTTSTITQSEVVTQSNLVTPSQASPTITVSTPVTTTVSTLVTTSVGSGSVSVTSTFGATQSELDLCELGPPGPCAYIRAGYVQEGNGMENLEEFNQNTTITKCDETALGMVIEVPFSLWNTGTMMVSLLLVEGVGNMSKYDEKLSTLLPPQSGDNINVEYMGVREDNTTMSPADGEGGGGVWFMFHPTYVGWRSRSSLTVPLDISLRQVDFGCRLALLGDDVITFTVSLRLEAAPLSYPKAVDTIIEAGVVTSGGLMIPSTIVRAGLTQSLLRMMRCNEFDATEEVGFTNNVFGWRIGREELQYQRGSVVTALILVAITLVLVAIAIVALMVGRGKGWRETMETLRLPSSLLAVVLLAAEMGTSSAVSLILAPETDASDMGIAAVYLVPLLMYLALYFWRAIQHPSYCTINVSELPRGEACRATTTQRLLRFVLRPTHESVLIDSGHEGIHWLTSHYQFIEDRRWPLFGALEALVGTILNGVEGIPITSTNRAACVAQPAAMVLFLAGLVIIAVAKAPNVVRLQQWACVGVTGALGIVAVLVTANTIFPSEELELAAAILSALIALFVMVVGMIELISVLARLYPPLREWLSMGVSLSSMIKRLREPQEHAAAATTAPLIQPTTNPHTALNIVDVGANGGGGSDGDIESVESMESIVNPPIIDEEDDDAYIARMIDRVDNYEAIPVGVGVVKLSWVEMETDI